MHRGCRQRLAVTEMEGGGGGQEIQKAEKPAEEQKSS